MKKLQLFTTVILILIYSQTNYAQVNFCQSYCDNPIADGCFSCDANELNGEYSYDFFPLYGSPSDASPICPDASLNTTIWHVFIAGSTSITLDIDAINCFAGCGNGSLDFGVMDGCEGECLVYSGCGSNFNSLQTINNLIVGNPYALWVDVCSCSCSFDMEVTNHGRGWSSGINV